MIAQNKDRIYMKNGSIINGYIQEMYPDSIIKIKTNDGNVFVFDSKDVLKTEYISSSKEKPWLETNGKKTYELHKGYKGFVDLSGGFFSNDYGVELAGFSVSTTHGYQFNKHWFVGGGFGFCLTRNDDYIPVFTNVRYNFSKRSGLFADVKMGSDFFNEKGGLFLSPSLGYRIALTKNIGLNAAISCEYHTSEEDLLLMVKIGIDF